MVIKIDKAKTSNAITGGVASENPIKDILAGKKRVRKWEKRWVFQPNVLDLNNGEIWV